MAEDDYLGLYYTDLIEARLLLHLAHEMIGKAKSTHLHSWEEEAAKADEEFSKACDEAFRAVRTAINAIDTVEKERIKFYLERKRKSG